VARFAGQRVLVTGGAGFIGSHLVDALLAEGAARVAVVDNFFLGKEANLDDARRAGGERLRVYREDAGEFTAMTAICGAEKPDIVFNLATKALLYSFFNPAGAAKVNIDVALALAELLRSGAYGRLVHLSSSEVYGTAQSLAMSEQHPLLAETSYAAGKAAADLVLASYVRMFALPVLIIRPFNNYGPRQNDGALAAVVPLTVRRIERGEKPVIHGDGLQTRDFIYVGDTVEAILKLANRAVDKGELLNLGSGRETSILEIVRAIAQLMDYRGEFALTEARPADVRRHCAGIDRVRALIGEVAITPLAAGLRRTIDWYRTEQ
jgi:UDP-glucose 4-epimerase